MYKNASLKSTFINWLIFILLSFIWGSSFVLMKEGLVVLSAYQVATIRILSAGIILMPFVWKSFKMIPRSKIGLVLLSGLIGSFFPAYLFCLAETRIDSSLAGILNALTTIFTIIIGVWFFELKAANKKIAGVIIGMAGLILLFTGNGKIDFKNISFSTLILVATFMYGINVNMVSKHLSGIGSLNIATLAFVFLIIPCIGILYTTGYFQQTFTRSILLSTLASSVLGIFGTAVASILFYMLIKRAGTLFSSMVTYGIPFVAVFWGVILGEKVTFIQVISLGIILSGVYLANSNKNPLSRKLDQREKGL